VTSYHGQFVNRVALLAVTLTAIASQAALSQTSHLPNQQDQRTILQLEQCVESPGEKDYTIQIRAVGESRVESQERMVTVGCAPAYSDLGYPDKPDGYALLLTPLTSDLVHVDLQVTDKPDEQPQKASKLLSLKEGQTETVTLPGYIVSFHREISPQPTDFNYTVAATVKTPDGAIHKEAQPLLVSVGGPAGPHGTVVTDSVRDDQYPACLPNNGLKAAPLPTGWRVTADQTDTGDVTFHVWTSVYTAEQLGSRRCYDAAPLAQDTKTIGPVKLDHGQSVSATFSNGYGLTISRD
jgi:hypothetical protein